MSTFMAKKETVIRNWYVIDATDQVVGRLAVANCEFAARQTQARIYATHRHRRFCHRRQRRKGDVHRQQMGVADL